jgi:hypothetical protein
MAMSRKDYVNLATAMGLALRYAERGSEHGGMRQMLSTVADALNSANTNFDRDRFVAFTYEFASGARDAQGRIVKGKAA